MKIEYFRSSSFVNQDYDLARITIDIKRINVGKFKRIIKELGIEYDTKNKNKEFPIS